MNKKLLILFFIATFIFLIAIALFCYRRKSNKDNNKLLVGKCEFEIEIANTPETRRQGLSGRKNLATDTGMLFVFDKPDTYSFWMKDMNFPLDFVWINNNTIADLTENLPIPIANKPTPQTQPKVPVNNVLEINAGLINKCQIKIGDQIK